MLKKLLLPLLLLLIVIPVQAEEPQSEPFIVMTYNIRYGTANDGPNRWELRKEALFKQIREVNPDLIGLQEALRFQLDELHNALPGYLEVGVGRDDGDTLGEYSAIFIREERFSIDTSGTFWFSDTPTVPGSATWGNHVTRICSWVALHDRQNGHSVTHYNLHLDHESQPSRVKSLELLADRIKQQPASQPVIVTGDFNIPLSNPAFTSLFLNGDDPITPPWPLKDTWLPSTPHDNSCPGTYNSFTGDTSGDKIDHILVSGGLYFRLSKALTDQIDGRYASDHFPVITQMSFEPFPTKD